MTHYKGERKYVSGGFLRQTLDQCYIYIITEETRYMYKQWSTHDNDDILWEYNQNSGCHMSRGFRIVKTKQTTLITSIHKFL